MKKSELTKKRVFEVALKLFAKNGFDETTMREIAAGADIAPGAIYYHFKSKESLVNEYYRQSHLDHLENLKDQFKSEGSFSKKLQIAVTTKIDVAQPYKEMARALFGAAANPESPLSPFSKESRALRLQSLEIFKQVVEDSSDKFHPKIKKVLPEYLWMYQMAVILFWIHDTSKNSKRTYELINKTVPLIEMASQFIQSPLAVPFRRKIISAFESFKPNLEKSFPIKKGKK